MKACMLLIKIYYDVYFSWKNISNKVAIIRILKPGYYKCTTVLCMPNSTYRFNFSYRLIQLKNEIIPLLIEGILAHTELFPPPPKTMTDQNWGGGGREGVNKVHYDLCENGE